MYEPHHLHCVPQERPLASKIEARRSSSSREHRESLGTYDVSVGEDIEHLRRLLVTLDHKDVALRALGEEMDDPNDEGVVVTLETGDDDHEDLAVLLAIHDIRDAIQLLEFEAASLRSAFDFKQHSMV